MSPLTYKDAGVDIDAGDQFLQSIKKDIDSTKQPWVLSDIGLFGGMIDLKMACEGFENPVLVQVMQGKSFNKQKERFTLACFEELGAEIVSNCISQTDSFSRPISFLDYIASQKLLRGSEPRFIKGMSAFCKDNKIPIIGGETAEMPVIYKDNCMTIVGILTVVIEAKDRKRIDRRYKGIKALPLASIFEAYKKPVLVQSIDGLGTKSKEQEFLGNSIRDILNHSKNDIAVHGAWPRCALLYIDANSRYQWNIFKKLSRAVGVDYELIIKHHPGIFQRGQVDLVCAISGLVEYDRLIDGSTIKPGDVFIGLPSAGLHTNGFSLARKVGVPLEELRKPHLSYLKPLNALNDAKLLKGAVHITGGGIPGNLIRILPKNCRAIVIKNTWPILPVFDFIQKKGPVEEKEMYKVFNMGLGMILVVAPDALVKTQRTLFDLHQHNYIIGEIVTGEKGVEIV